MAALDRRMECVSLLRCQWRGTSLASPDVLALALHLPLNFFFQFLDFAPPLSIDKHSVWIRVDFGPVPPDPRIHPYVAGDGSSPSTIHHFFTPIKTALRRTLYFMDTTVALSVSSFRPVATDCRSHLVMPMHEAALTSVYGSRNAPNPGITPQTRGLRSRLRCHTY